MICDSSIHLCFGDALSHYDEWDSPTLVISDGPYGLNGYDGDLRRPDQLPAWYEPHVAAWTCRATRVYDVVVLEHGSRLGRGSPRPAGRGLGLPGVLHLG